MVRSLSWSRIIPTLALVLGAVGFGQSGGQGQGRGEGEGVGVGDPERLAAWLEIAVLRGDTGRITPARVYLFKDGNPFRLSPVDVLLPLRVDRFYRERLWRRPPELKDAGGQPARTRTLEVTNDGESHFILLDGEARYSLPAGNYRVEAYHGLRWAPAVEDFVLKAGERRRVSLTLHPLDNRGGWISGDDHIHLTRAAEDDDVFLRWLEADDLSVGNFLQLQRQVDAAVQYAFGREGEVTAPGRSIRSGQESRSEFYGHINLLGPSWLIRPVSVGTMYANTPEAYPFPNLLFAQGRSLGAAVGYAHFDGSMPHSTLPMDLALGAIDFIEVFQFGVLKADPWYELLNAGFRVTGVAGSDFPANLGRFKPWPRAIPLLGPERTLVKIDADVDVDVEERPQAEANAGRSAYDRWVEGVKKGEAVVSNGPLLDLQVDGQGPGAVLAWKGESKSIRGEARASSHRSLELLEIVVNGQVAAARAGDGRQKELHLPFEIPVTESVWVAARVRGERVASANEPEIQAHTNPVYVLRDRRPVHVKSAREAVATRWRRDLDYYRGTDLAFADPKQRQELETALERATRILESAPQPWP
jgi:hypothetical protein